VNDIAVALRIAHEYRLSPFQTRALLCTRVIENGRAGYAEYGVVHPHAISRGHIIQSRWAAGSIRKRLHRPEDLPSFAARWCPAEGTAGLSTMNQHWLGNMQQCLAQLAESDAR